MFLKNGASGLGCDEDIISDSGIPSATYEDPNLDVSIEVD